MLLKDLMEEKQLNLDQPLLTVRRFATTKADSKRKKDNNSSAKAPPHIAHKPELKSGPLRIAGNVPFLWEKAPGKPKDQSKSHTQFVENPRDIAPNYPPGRTSSNVSNSQSILASLKEENSEEKVSSYSDDETFVDALDTLSRAESLFMSSSGNSMSGLDDQDVKPSGLSVSSSDQQARNFIIDRFLPAAQAMISETHQYGSFRKQIVGQEKQKQVKKVVNVEKSFSLDQQKLKTQPHCGQDKTDESNEAESYTATGCGLFPRLCLLNQIPGLRMEDKVQSSSAVNGMQAKSTASLIGTTKEHARTPSYRKKSLDSNAGFAEEKDIMCVTEKGKHGTIRHQKGCRKLLKCERTQHDSSHESPVVEKTLYVDSVQKIKSHSGSCSSDMKCKTSHKGSGISKNPSNDKPSQHKNLEPLDMKTEIINHSKKTESEKQGLKKAMDKDSDSDSVSASSTKVAESKKITDSARQVPSNQNNSTGLIENSEAAKSVDKEFTHGSELDHISLAATKVGDNRKIDLERQCLKKLGHQGKFKSDAGYLQLQLAIPSLKAPSESWLKRTLPTITSKNTLRKPNLASNTCARSQHYKTPLVYTKWETIVKSSNVNHGYQRLHKELLTTIPEA